MSFPFIYILWGFDGKTEMLLQTIVVLKQRLVRAVTRDYAMRLFSVYGDVLMG